MLRLKGIAYNLCVFIAAIATVALSYVCYITIYIFKYLF